MGADINSIGILVRREIEARIAGPLVRAFARELGMPRTLSVVQPLITDLARQSGAQLARQLGGNSIAHFVEGMRYWLKDDALEIDVLEQTERTFSYNATRCRYAEMYRELGMADLGVVFSCGRDFAMCEGFNPCLKLTRTQTIMEGAPYCDFRYRLEFQK